jgi:hypothetical protein
VAATRATGPTVAQPGDTDGRGLGGVWFAVAPSDEMITG